MTAGLTFRLAVWREWRSRGAIYVLLAACVAIGPAFPERMREGWEAFVMLVLFPAAVIFAGAGGSAAPDAFWRGLGGPAWARVAGATAVRLLGLGTPYAAAFSMAAVRGTSLVQTAPFALLLLTLFTTLQAARAMGSGVRVLAGPLSGAVLLFASVAIGEWAELWEVEASIGARLGAIAAGALVVTPWLEGRFGAWGAGVKRGVARGVAGVFGLALVGAAFAEGASAMFAPTGVYIESFDATRVLRLDWRGRTHLRYARAFLEVGGEQQALGAAIAGSLGPHGAWAVQRGSVADGGGDEVVFSTRDLLVHGYGGEVACPVKGDGWCWDWHWREDGDAVVADFGNEVWVADTASGCRRLEGDDGAWLGEQLVEVAAGVVTVDGREVARLEAYVKLVQAGAHVLATTWRGETDWVWRVEPDGLTLLASGARVRGYAAGDVPGVRLPGPDRCWLADGTPVESEGTFLDAGHVLDEAGRVVIALNDGRRWTLPDDRRWRARDLRFVAPDTVLAARDGAVVRLTPDP